MRRRILQEGMVGMMPSPTGPTARAATAARSRDHLRRPSVRFTLGDISGRARSGSYCRKSRSGLFQCFCHTDVREDTLLVEPATTRIIEALAHFLAVATEIAELCVSTFGRKRLSHCWTWRGRKSFPTFVASLQAGSRSKLRRECLRQVAAKSLPEETASLVCS